MRKKCQKILAKCTKVYKIDLGGISSPHAQDAAKISISLPKASINLPTFELLTQLDKENLLDGRICQRNRGFGNFAIALHAGERFH